ncbi:MAG: hypothetical protein M1814_006197 [Vezdaea aestivalis]|nr:MAG: hypothetical protein M1814_006197 [Vezdaea aestivalis]
MAGPLVPAGSSGRRSFAQQGQVDWVALSGTTVQLSVAVLARLSRAGVEEFTIQIGRAICSSFAISSPGQIRVMEAVGSLKKYGSFDNVLWFGFGVKDIITNLSDTEEGLALIALSSALATSFGPIFAAQTLRMLCLQRQAPRELIPSLRQWKALVCLCEPILSSSKFSLLVSGFSRLLYVSHATPIVSEDSSDIFAKAIIALADISNGKITNATFIGQGYCAWLAAFAEWILSLAVEIVNEHGDCSYRSGPNSEHRLAQVTIVCSKSVVQNKRESLTTYITTTTFHLSDVISVLQSHDLYWSRTMNRRSSWATILQDTFPAAIHSLVNLEDGRPFANYLYGMAALAHLQSPGCSHGESPGSLRRGASNPISSCLWIHLKSCGRGYIQFASERLPELTYILKRSNAASRPDDWNNPIEHKLRNENQENINRIKAMCGCSRCHYVDLECGFGHSSGSECLFSVSETVFLYLWILASLAIDDGVLPSSSGLLNLNAVLVSVVDTVEIEDLLMGDDMFNGLLGPGGRTIFGAFPCQGLELIHCVLSGRPFPKKMASRLRSEVPLMRRFSSVAGDGMCVFLQGLKDPDQDPESFTTVHVIPGSIFYEGTNYGRIEDSNVVSWKFDDVNWKTARRNWRKELLVRESEDDQVLQLSFKISLPEIRLEKILYPVLLSNSFGHKEVPASWNSFTCSSRLEAYPTFTDDLQSLSSGEWWLVHRRFNAKCLYIEYYNDYLALYLMFLRSGAAYDDNHLMLRISPCTECMVGLRHLFHPPMSTGSIAIDLNPEKVASLNWWERPAGKCK